MSTHGKAGIADRIDRRTLFRLLTGMGLAWFAPIRSIAAMEDMERLGGFTAVSGAPPKNPLLVPDAPISPPPGSSSVVYDIFGNHWCIGAPRADGNRQTMVLPGQAPNQWMSDTLSNLPANPWKFIAADEFGYIWIASSSRCMRLDPHRPEQGWLDLTTDLLGPDAQNGAQITALGIAASGAAIFAVKPPKSTDPWRLMEIDRTHHTTVQRSAAPAGIENIACDEEGNLWLQRNGVAYRRPPAADAWQRHWQLIDRLPAGDHDLSGDVMNGRFYMAGGQNAGWGYPAKPHVFRDLMAFDPTLDRWSIVAVLGQPRFYNGTSWLDGRIWIIGGNTRDAEYKPVTLSSVEIWNPNSKTLIPGPPLPVPLDNPVALHIDDRIYCAGFIMGEEQTGACLLFSIGKNDISWHREPDGPSYKLALAATVYRESIYLALPEKGLACFDTRSRTWSLLPVSHAMRSPQMATYHDRIWIMGGRDIEHQDQTIIFNPSDGSWSTGPNLPRELAWGAATVVDGRLMVVGGAAGRSYSNRTFYLRKQPIS